MIDNLVTLGFLVLLQAVLGFDNLLYISLESKRAPAEKRAMARKVGIGAAVFLRIALLFLLIELIAYVQDPLFGISLGQVIEATGGHGEATEVHGWIDGHFNLHSLIVLAGGAFIMYTAVKEIWHMLNIETDHVAGDSDADSKSFRKVVGAIIVMNLVFSFDSILSAMALTDVFWVMATAIIIGGIMMIWLADHVSTFLERNRLFEVLGLFILLIVGVMLVSEGGHLAHLYFFGSPVVPMTKATFYFVITVLVLTDLVQSRYQKKLTAESAAIAEAAAKARAAEAAAG